jgi:hypothetical protein
MTDSMNLLSAQVSFLVGRQIQRPGLLHQSYCQQNPNLALVHVPVELYPLCVQPILRLLFGEDHDEDAATISWMNRHDFLNFSVTPVGYSIVCSRQLAERFIRPIATMLNKLHAATRPNIDVQISEEDYIVIQVAGKGIDATTAGQRVLELTSPLAMAGMYVGLLQSHNAELTNFSEASSS